MLLEVSPTGDNDVSTAPQHQRFPGSSDDVLIIAFEEDVDKAVEEDTIEPIPLTHNPRTRPQLVDFFYKENQRDE